MSTNYAGSGTTINTTIPLLDDGDEPSAALWRQSFEPIIDSLAALDGGVSAKAIRVTGGTFVLEANITISEGAGPYRWNWESGMETRYLAGSLCHFNAGSDMTCDGTFAFGSGATTTYASGATLAAATGSTVNLSGAVNFGNSSETVFDTSAEVEMRGLWTVTGTGQVVFQASSTLAISGAASVESGGVATVKSGGRIDVASGGELRLARGRDLTINPGELVSLDLMLTPMGSGFDSGAPIWRYDNDNTLSNFAWLQVATTAGAKNFLAFAVPGRAGDVIDNFVVRVQGGFGAGHGSNLPADVPIARLVSIVDGVVTVIASASDASVNAAGYDAVHNISSATGLAYTFNGSSSEHVYLQILGESGSNSIASTTAVHRAIVNITRNSVLGNAGREYL